MPERFIFGYEIPDQYGITLADVIEAIRQERLQPYHQDTKERLPAPSVKKRGDRFSSDEIMSACMKENGKRRKQGLGPLDPGTPEYDAFLDKCWHTEDSYSWKHLKDSEADKVKQWCFLVEEIERLIGQGENNKPPWLSGSDLLQQPRNLTKEYLFSLVVSGRLVPYDASEKMVVRHLFPNEALKQRYGEMLTKVVERQWLEERLSKTDEELISERLEDRIALPKGVGELEQGTRLEELLPQRRLEWKQKLAVIEAEIRDLEATLHPSKAWKGLGSITPSEQDEIFERLLTATYKTKEVDRVLLRAPTVEGTASTGAAEQVKEGGAIDDALIQKARELLPKVKELWSLILAGDDNPLKLRTESDLKSVAIDILEDDPSKWLPIKEEHLKGHTLYNTAPDRAGPIFERNLLSVVLESQGYAIRNKKELLKEAKTTL